MTIKTNNKHIIKNDVFFCFLNAEKYLTSQNLLDVSKIYVVSGFFKRAKWKDILNELKYKKDKHQSNNEDIINNIKKKIIELEGEQLRSTFIKELKKKYQIPNNLTAITGTKGKTSSCWFIFQLLNLCHQNCGYIGTIGVYYYKNNTLNKINKNDNLTTPQIEDLYYFLDRMKKNGIENVIFEASSHSLEQARIAGLHIKISGFTNLTQDHLDYHKTMDNYFNAKAKLFQEYQQIGDIAIINNDDERSAQLKTICKEKQLKIITFGLSKDSDFYIKSIKQNATKQEVNFKYKNKQYTFDTKILGKFQISNIAMALLITEQYGINMKDILNKVSIISAPFGRMQQVLNENIFIDYAHTPKSLEESLLTLKSIYDNIILIFGCGGDRDRQKRPIMFHIASKIADTIIITSDNPRTEDPKKIIEDMVCFLNQKDNQLKNNVFVIDEIRKIDNKYNNLISQKQIIDKTIIEIDRKKAIILGVKQYLNKTKQKTALLIAGKGHEDYQINGNIKIHFSDFEEVEKILKNNK